jgi:hypothetical protein
MKEKFCDDNVRLLIQTPPKAGFNFTPSIFFGYLSSITIPRRAIAEMINNNL